ncbi:MAG: peptidoglycan DD-metalloendopeptidase family protein [Firmicutes bacterium]|nr:peptidoglycan DD-metalloendopeptidase family protein [Bacillota bacterium]
MIENRELYSFEETEDPASTEPFEDETLSEDPTGGSPKILDQLIVAFLCLVLILAFCRQEHGWGGWLRGRLHSAVNASADSTFGLLWNSDLVQSIARNVNNLVRLEKITRTLSRPGSAVKNDSFPADSVWPVPGNIIKEYGEFDRNGAYGTGVLIDTPGQVRVMAVASGTVSRIEQTGAGWLVEVDHGGAWRSTYLPLDRIQVRPNQALQTGEIIGRVGLLTGGGRNALFLEIKHNGQPVNPRTVIR